MRCPCPGDALMQFSRQCAGWLRRALRCAAFVGAALVATALLPMSANAQEAQVRLHLSTEGPVWVGQGVSLAVDLLAPGYFASAVSFDLPDPRGVLLLPPVGRPLVSTEVIDGTHYSVQAHEIRAWPMRAGEQSIPAFNIRFAFKRAPLDTDTVPVTLTVQPIPLSARQPPGAEHAGTVISASNLQVTETWSPEPGAEPVKAGAAFTRIVTFTAPDVPGMVFPPFPTGQIDGLGIYSKRRLLDQDDRGTLLGKRQDEITYIAKRPGQFTIPAAQYTWFDLDTQQLRSATLPARTLQVIANPEMASATQTGVADATGSSWPGWLYSLWSRAGSWYFAALLGAAVLLLPVLLLPASRRQLGRALRTAVAPLRAVHLQPLNPTEKSIRRQRH